MAYFNLILSFHLAPCFVSFCWRWLLTWLEKLSIQFHLSLIIWEMRVNKLYTQSFYLALVSFAFMISSEPDIIPQMHHRHRIIYPTKIMAQKKLTELFFSFRSVQEHSLKVDLGLKKRVPWISEAQQKSYTSWNRKKGKSCRNVKNPILLVSLKLSQCSHKRPAVVHFLFPHST